MSDTPETDHTESRRAFERWFEDNAMPFEHSNWFRRRRDGSYKLTSVDNAWDAWMAAKGWSESRHIARDLERERDRYRAALEHVAISAFASVEEARNAAFDALQPDHNACHQAPKPEPNTEE